MTWLLLAVVLVVLTAAVWWGLSRRAHTRDTGKA